MSNPKSKAIESARFWLEKKPIYLDTETTGLDYDDQICDLAIIDCDGTTLLNTLIKPTILIPGQASDLHHITNQMVAEAPGFDEIIVQFRRIVEDRLIIIYNAGFDTRMIQQTMAAHRLDPVMVPAVDCAMLMYARFWGDWNNYHKSYRWHRLSAAARQCGLDIPSDLHRARADADLCRQVVEYVAGSKTLKGVTE